MRSNVQVKIRSNPKEFEEGQDLARACRDVLHAKTVSGYWNIEALQSEPIYLGEDETNRHRWSINFQLSHDV